MMSEGTYLSVDVNWRPLVIERISVLEDAGVRGETLHTRSWKMGGGGGGGGLRGMLY